MKTEEVILHLKNRNPDIYKYLYKEYFGMILFFVGKNSGNKSDAEDLFQDTLIVLYQNCKESSFQLQCALKTYIYSIARNLWLKKLREQKHKASLNDFESYIQIEIADEEEVMNESLFVKLQQALQNLGEKCRTILRMFYFEKQSMEIIAQQLQYTNAANAKNQKYKCLQQLKKGVQGE